MRARLALAVSGFAVELREVVLRDKPAALLAASPKATVPVLVLPGGAVLAESLDIMRLALGRHDPLGWLPAPGGAPGQDALIAACDGPFKQALDRCKYPERFPQVPLDAAWQAALAWLADLEQRLQQHAHLCGARASLADAALFPFVRQFAAIDGARWAALPFPAVQAWLASWLASPLFAEVMHKHAPWREGDAPLRMFSAPVPGLPAAPPT